jgi:hypothetical protein
MQAGRTRPAMHARVKIAPATHCQALLHAHTEHHEWMESIIRGWEAEMVHAVTQSACLLLLAMNLRGYTCASHAHTYSSSDVTKSSTQACLPGQNPCRPCVLLHGACLPGMDDDATHHPCVNVTPFTK